MRCENNVFDSKGKIIHGFYNYDNWVNKIHPSIRVVSSVLISSFIAMACNLSTLFIGLVVSMLLTLSVKLKLRLVAKKFYLVFGMLLFFWVVIPLTYEPNMVSNGKYINVIFLLPLQITLRTVSILLFFISLISTMNVDTLGFSLRYLYLPKKIIYLLLVTYRYIFIIEQEYRKLLCAIKVRAFYPGTNIHTYRTYSYLIGVLFVNAHERARRVHHAMICRSFKGDFFTVRKYSLNKQSLIFMLGTVLFIFFLCFFNIKKI